MARTEINGHFSEEMVIMIVIVQENYIPNKNLISSEKCFVLCAWILIALGTAFCTTEAHTKIFWHFKTRNVPPYTFSVSEGQISLNFKKKYIKLVYNDNTKEK